MTVYLRYFWLIGIGALLLLWFPDLCSRLLFAALLSFLLRPITERLCSLLGMRRNTAALLTLLIVGMAAAGILLAMLPVFSSQLTELWEQRDIYRQGAERLMTQAQQAAAKLGLSIPARELDMAPLLSTLAGYAAKAAGTLGETVAQAVFVLICCFYLLAEPKERLLGWINRLPLAWVPTAEQFCRDTGRMLRGYFRSRVLLALFAAAFSGIGFSLVGVRYAYVYAVLLFLLDFIPYVGPIAGGAIPVLTAVLEGGIGAGVPVLLILIAAQQLEESVIGPRMQADAIGVHPIAGMFSLLCCVRLFGAVGMFLAIPFAGVVRILLGMWLDGKQAERIVLEKG